VTARSYLFVPGDNERKIEKAFGSAADALIFDLEDSVLPERTIFARDLVRRTLKDSVSRCVPELWVRINALSTRNAMADIDAVVCAGLRGVVVPKVDSPEEVKMLDRTLTALETTRGIAQGAVLIFAMVPETPQALFTLGGYAGASPRLSTMSWGAEDLSVALGASTNRDTNGDLSFTYRMARSLCLIAAKAAGAAAVETLWPDFRDVAGLQKSAVAARREGFTGMIAIHPDQVPVINAAFTPGDEEVAHARRVVDAFAAKPGAGTVGLDGRMLDRLHLKRAQAVLASALASSKRHSDS
jgi:citrate lyase subunit beta/citryl-CoA lyase